MEEKKFAFIFDNTSDSIYLTDIYGYIMEVNKTALKVLGYEKNELLRKNVREITSLKFKTQISENFSIVVRNGEFIFENEFITSQNVIVPFEIKSKVIDYEDKPMIINVARSITERKEFEKKLLTTIVQTEEKERKRIAADLHDGLSPVLSTIKLYTDLLKKKEHQKTNKEEIIQTIDELIDLAVATAKEISVNITPSILHDFGLAVAIKEFCNYINKSKSINIVVNTDNYNISERTIIESVLYQATKELINNTLRHSNAHNIAIELKNENDQIILYYKDDGIGFDINNMISNSAGLGLKNIVNKIKSIKGTCDYYSSPNQGMVFIIVVKF